MLFSSSQLSKFNLFIESAKSFFEQRGLDEKTKDYIYSLFNEIIACHDKSEAFTLLLQKKETLAAQGFNDTDTNIVNQAYSQIMNILKFMETTLFTGKMILSSEGNGKTHIILNPDSESDIIAFAVSHNRNVQFPVVYSTNSNTGGNLRISAILKQCIALEPGEETDYPVYKTLDGKDLGLIEFMQRASELYFNSFIPRFADYMGASHLISDVAKYFLEDALCEGSDITMQIGVANFCVGVTGEEPQLQALKSGISTNRNIRNQVMDILIKISNETDLDLEQIDNSLQILQQLRSVREASRILQ